MLYAGREKTTGTKPRALYWEREDPGKGVAGIRNMFHGLAKASKVSPPVIRFTAFLM